MLDWLTRIEERQSMDGWKKETESRIVLTERSGTVDTQERFAPLARHR